MSFGPRRRLAMADVRARRADIEAVAREHGVRSVAVFGSVARGDADEESDLDLLVVVEPTTGAFLLTGFALAVEDLLGVHTQVATPAGLKPWVKQRVLAEAVPL